MRGGLNWVWLRLFFKLSYKLFGARVHVYVSFDFLRCGGIVKIFVVGGVSTYIAEDEVDWDRGDEVLEFQFEFSISIGQGSVGGTIEG